MPSTMETWAKLTGGYGVLKGGIAGANKQLKKLGPEAKMERIQKKEDAKIKKEATKEFIRDHKTTKQALREGKITIQEAQEEYKKTVEAHTAKIQAIKTGPDVAGQDNKTGGPDVAGQDISGIDSVAIVSAIENQTVEIITELGTDSPKDAGSPKLESDAKFTPDSPEDTLFGQGVPESSPENTLLGQVESIWGYAKAFTVGTGSEAKPDPVKVDAGSSLWALEEAITQEQILKGQRDVAKHLIETNVLLFPMKSALAELVEMGRDDLAFDARREKREIKEDARALEDRRDANKKGLDKKGSSGSSGSSGSPTLNKEGEEGFGLTQSEGILSAISAYFMGKAGGLTNMIKKGFKFAFKPVTLLGTALGFKAATPTPTGIPTGTPTVTPTPVGDPRVKPTTGEGKMPGKGSPTGTPKAPDVPDVPKKEMSKLAKFTTKWAKGFTKLVSRGAKAAFPIDIIGKMEQGQGFWESMGNMVYEVGQMGVGGVDWVSEKVTGGEGLLSAKASDYIIKSGDILGNEGKWNTHWMERGINTTMAAWTGTEREADKKQWTEEQKQLAMAAENELGAVDLGYGLGQIERLEALTLLDPKSLEALLAYQVWSDKDQKLIEDIRDAKVQGRSVKYNDGGWFGFERVDFGEESPTVKASRLNRGLGDNVSGRRDIRGGPGNADDPTVADEDSAVTTNGVPPTVADEDSILEAVANKKEAKIKKIRLLVAGPGNAADPTVADEDSSVFYTDSEGTSYKTKEDLEKGLEDERRSREKIKTWNYNRSKKGQKEIDYSDYDKRIREYEEISQISEMSEEDLRSKLGDNARVIERRRDQDGKIKRRHDGSLPPVVVDTRTQSKFIKEELKRRAGPVEVGSAESPTVNGVPPTGETNKTAWSDRDEFQYENYKDILPKLATYLSGRLPGEPKDGSRKKWRGMYYDHPEFKKRFEELGGSTSGSPGIYKRKWQNVTFQHSKDFENLYNERRGLPLAKTELNPEGLNIYPKGLLEKLAKEEQKSRADPSGGAGPTMMEVDDVLEEALTKAELKLKATDVGTPEYADAMNKVARLEQDIKKLEWMSSEEFNELTPDSKIMESFYNAPRPDPEKQDEVAIAMLTPGSIHVHDMKAESAIKNLMLTPIETTPPPVEANFDQIPATVLEQAIVTATMQAATTNQAVAQGGGSRMVNAPTSIDNSSHQILTPPSSAHSPGVPPGSGHMGITTPRG